MPELFCILIIYLNHIHIYQLHVQRVQHICRAKIFKQKILGINSLKKIIISGHAFTYKIVIINREILLTESKKSFLLKMVLQQSDCEIYI